MINLHFDKYGFKVLGRRKTMKMFVKLFYLKDKRSYLCSLLFISLNKKIIKLTLVVLVLSKGLNTQATELRVKSDVI